MADEKFTDGRDAEAQPADTKKHIDRLKIAGLILTVFGVSLFIYFAFSVGFGTIASGIKDFGVVGFAVILCLHFCRICIRAAAWDLSVHEPYSLTLRHSIPAVVIGEAMSSMVPLGILVSGTSKAVAVRKKIPLIGGLASVATENLFYSFTTSIFLIVGSLVFVRTFQIDEAWRVTIDGIIAAIGVILVFLTLMVIRQWHFASEACGWLYNRGILKGILEKGRYQVRLFENLIYDFYRRYPKRFLPIIVLEFAYHALGVAEVWFVLSRISDDATFLNAFLLESVSRLVTIVFKFVPFLVGVDEAGANFVAETVGMAAGLGVTLAIIRKGRIVFWALIGVALIIKRGLTLGHFLRAANKAADSTAADK
jgi:hypothetical protein